MSKLIEEARKIHKETVVEVQGLVFDGVRPLIVEMLEQTPEEDFTKQQPDPATNPPTAMDNVVPPNATATAPIDPSAPAEPSPLDDLTSSQQTPTPAMPTPAAPANDFETQAAPIQASPVAGMPMPGPDGKITVNFEDLWSTKAGQQPEPPAEQQPATVAPETPQDQTQAIPADQQAQQPPANNAQPSTEDSELPPELQLENKIDLLANCFIDLKKTTNLNETQKKFFELSLLEMLDEIDAITIKTAKGRINKLFLERKLNELYNSVVLESKKDNNSYYQSKGPTRMNKATLREFKAKLALNEEAAAPYLNKDEKNAGEAFGKPLKQDPNAAKQDAHTKGASDGRPVKDPGKKALPAEKKADEEKPWFKGTPEKPLSENALEQLEEELMEMLGMTECDDSKEVVMGEAEGSLEECAGEPVSVNVKISAGPGVSLDMADDSASDDVGGSALDMSSLSDDEELEIIDDDDDMSSDDEVSDVAMKDDDSDSDDLDLSDDEDDEEENKPGMVSELKRQLAEKKKELNETQVLTACSLYTNKIFANYHNLSERQKRKIVKYFDGVGTIAEAKAVYTTIKNVLSENVATKKPIAESASRVVKPSTKQEVVTESTSPLSKVTFDADRWQILAGISKK
jgi:hypothetical protein